MTEDEVIVRTQAAGRPRRCPVGDAVVYRSSVWVIKGLYLTPGRDGEREACLIVGERRLDELEDLEERPR
jgi:hypothetical protein